MGLIGTDGLLYTRNFKQKQKRSLTMVIAKQIDEVNFLIRDNLVGVFET